MPVVAVTPSLHYLVVVTLLGADVAQTGAASHDVDDYTWKRGTGTVGQAFQLQADARAGTGRHHSEPASGGAVHHLYRSDFAFGLQKCPAYEREECRCGFGYFAGRCYRIAVVRMTSCHDCTVDRCVITFHQLACHQLTSSGT